MQYFKLNVIAASLLFLTPMSVSANCLVCDELIKMDEARATCFLDNYDDISKAVSEAPNKRRAIDLDSCSIDGEVLALRGGIATMPTLKGNASPEGNDTKSVYTLDSTGLACLRALVATQERPVDPVATFDLFEMCQQ